MAVADFLVSLPESKSTNLVVAEPADPGQTHDESRSLHFSRGGRVSESQCCCPECPADNVVQFEGTSIRHLPARGRGEMPPASVRPLERDGDADIPEM